MEWLQEKEQLEKFLKDNISYEEMGRYYGVSGAAVKKQLKKMGFVLPKKRKINDKEHFNKNVRKKIVYCLYCGKILNHNNKKYCDNKCQNEYEYKQYIERWKRGEENGIVGKADISNHIKRYLFEKHNNKCEKCNWDEKNPYTENIPLQVHHIDGDALNNKEDNLQLLCPNCHSLTENYGNIGNRTSKRSFRRKNI